PAMKPGLELLLAAALVGGLGGRAGAAAARILDRASRQDPPGGCRPDLLCRLSHPLRAQPADRQPDAAHIGLVAAAGSAVLAALASHLGLLPQAGRAPLHHAGPVLPGGGAGSRPRRLDRGVALIQELTAPLRMTMLPCVVTDRPSASRFAFRWNARSIDCLTSSAFGGGGGRGIWLSTSATPGTLPATNSASLRWYCQAAVPVSVTRPLSAFGIDRLGDEAVQRHRLQHGATGRRPADRARRGSAPRGCCGPRWRRRRARPPSAPRASGGRGRE